MEPLTSSSSTRLRRGRRKADAARPVLAQGRKRVQQVPVPQAAAACSQHKESYSLPTLVLA
jgi:hypothetical protein